MIQQQIYQAVTVQVIVSFLSLALSFVAIYFVYRGVKFFFDELEFYQLKRFAKGKKLDG